MLGPDSWQEIWETVRKNKLRTCLTGLAVAWGIFMLVILLAAGSGLENGVQQNFKDDAVNSLWVFSGKTSMPHEGRGPGRRIQLRNGDHDAVARLDGVEHISSRYLNWGDQVRVRYEDRVGSFDVRSVHPAHKHLEKTVMMKGRFLDDLDLAERRKVVVIGKAVEEFLFLGEAAIGHELLVNNIAFTIVGVFEDVGGEGEEKQIYLPITTAQMTFNGADKVNMVMFTVGDATVDESKRLEGQLTNLLAERHGFSPDDTQAIRVRNNLEQFRKIADIFVGIRFVVWVIGIGTILAGIVGVSNIMLISVKERTREFGVRKALGATPASIIGMVLQEAIVLTALSGYLGLLAGIALVELAARTIADSDMFANPEINFQAAFGATALLVVAGALAGFFPAWRAARINPIEALRDE